jgi:hypothetical protein
MLSSIHPFGERSRNNVFARTAGAHVIGSTFGGALLGLVAGALGWLVTSILGPSTDVRTSVVLLVAVVALGFEATSRERLLPSRTRQVNENWIQNYRGWVYGGGFGAELGFGVSTIITTSLVHLLVVSMVLIGSLLGALALGILFGFTRGITVLAAHNVDSPDALRVFHQRLDSLRARSHMGAVASLTVASIIGLTAVIA